MRLALVALLCASAQDADPVPLTDAERAWVAANPVVRIAPTGDYQPTEFFDESGAWSGMTADIFAELGRRLPLRFEVLVLSRDETADASAAAMGADIIPLSAPTASRRLEWLFSPPYLEYPAHVIVRDDRGVTTLADLDGQRVGVVRGWAAEEYLRVSFPEIEVVRCDGTRSGLRDLSFGQLDAFVSDLPSATWALREEGLVNLRVGAPSGYVYRMGISTRADLPILHGLLCKALARMPTEQRDRIYEKWMRAEVSPSGPSHRTLQIVFGAAALAALLSIIALAWNRGLARQVARRTAEVERELARRRESERHQRFMVRELDHRVKNTLATVLAVSDQTRRKSDTLQEFAEAFRGRIAALSRVHEALSSNAWEGASLRQVAARTLEPHAAERAQLIGPEVTLPPDYVQPLSMALHELTTNAIKYGSLSNATGIVELRWELHDDELRLDWTESGGPPVEPTSRTGFGTPLIRAGVAYELGGEVDLSFERAGVRCAMTIPLRPTQRLRALDSVGDTQLG